MSAFPDLLTGKQHIGPLKTANGWPAPEGTQFVESGTRKERGDAVVCLGHLLRQNELGEPEWEKAKVIFPNSFSIKTLLECYAAQLQGGPRILRYSKCPSFEFIALEVVDGMNLSSFGGVRSGEGRKREQEIEKMEAIAFELTRHVISIHAADGVHVASDECSGTVSDRLRSKRVLRDPGRKSRHMVQPSNTKTAGDGGGSSGRAEGKNLLGGVDPLATLIFELDVFLGLRKVPSPRGAVGGGVHQTVLDRYLLADTVFEMFGGRVDHPRPEYMSKDMYEFLVGLSSSNIQRRFHAEADITAHFWMKKRAAIAFAVPPGLHGAGDVPPPAVEAVRTMWTPQLANMAKVARTLANDSDPVIALTQMVRGFASAGPAVAEGATASQTTGGAARASSKLSARTGVRTAPGVASTTRNISGVDAEDGVIEERERDYEGGASSRHTGMGESKGIDTSNNNGKGNRMGNEKGKGNGNENSKGKGKGRGKRTSIQGNTTMASPTRSDSEEARPFLRNTSNPEGGGDGSARTRGMPRKRKLPPGSASDGSTGTPTKRSRRSYCRSQGSASGAASDAPTTAPVEGRMTSPGAPSLAAPAMSSNTLGPCTPFYPISVMGCSSLSDHTQHINGGSNLEVLRDGGDEHGVDGVSANDVEGPGNAGSVHEAHGDGANSDDILSDDGNNSGENGEGRSDVEVMGDGGSDHEGANNDGGGSDADPNSSNGSVHDGQPDALDEEMGVNGEAGDHGADDEDDDDGADDDDDGDDDGDDDDDDNLWGIVSNAESGVEALEYEGVDVEMVTDHGSDEESSEDDGLDAILLPYELAIVNDDSSYHQAYDDEGGFDIVSDNGSGNGGYESGGVDIEMIADDDNVNDGFEDDDGSDAELLPDEVAMIADDSSDPEAYGDAEDNYDMEDDDDF